MPSWGKEFSAALRTVIHITQYDAPAPRRVAKAAREGRTPGLTAASLCEAITFLTRYAESLERP